jgi:hypothetical protein
MKQSIIKKRKEKRMKQSKDPFESPPPESPNSNSLKGVSEDEKDNMNVELAKFPDTDQFHKMAKMQLVTTSIFILFFFSCHDFFIIIS